MKKMNSNEIRKTWINYFKNNDHFEIESASLIPINDNSLLWINSGVATLKKYFSGECNPPYPNLTNSQKSIRTNDIFNVGITARHHTFFEMLGNFSIGGYFKEKAIELAYDILKNHFEINFDLIYITVFEEDEITYKKWLDLGIDQKHIIKCGRDRNFWDVGSGPCGPCTEIYYDRGLKYDEEKVGEKLFFDDIENDRYVEIWNIVFSEFNNDGNNNYTQLDRKNIDTGAGLERLACISQDVPTNFDTDLFQGIINSIEKISKYKYDINSFFTKNNNQKKINLNYKIISDHARASIFAIADGAIPSNKERGYILRRLIRRMIVMLHQLEIDDNIFELIVSSVIESMKDYYPYLIKNKNKIIDVLSNEYEIFKKTLNQGFKLFNESIKDNKLDKDIIFKLVETYGFPIELIKELSNEKNIEIDINGFEELFKEHQKISNARLNEIAMSAQNGELLNLNTEFKFDYDLKEMKSKVVKLYDEDFKPIETLNSDGYIVFDKTCFYATSGGQLHDIGSINETIEVDNVIKGPNLQHIHHVKSANLKLGDICNLKIDNINRDSLTRNHSVEHLIHASLTKLIDKNLKQEGAFKSAEKVTFDFQYHLKLTDDQLKMIEDEINNIIEQSIKTDVLECSLEEAQKIGAKAYFEDVYKKIIGKLRVVKMGDVSCELCGGTHVKNTNDIQRFKIIKFSPNGAGSWRIEAITSEATIKKWNDEKNNLLKEKINKIFDEYKTFNIINNEFTKLIEDANKTNDLDELTKYSDIIDKEFFKIKTEFSKELCESQKQFIKSEVNKKIKDDIIIINLNDYNNKYIFMALNECINEIKNKVFVFFNTIDNKIQYLIAADENYCKDNKINLNTNIKKLNDFCNGKGGGKPNSVQGGSNEIKDISSLNKVILESFK